MNLYDFYGDEALTDLRNRMRADFPKNFTTQKAELGITLEELEKLAGGGLEGDLNDIKILEDGTLAYKGQLRVLVHIKDVNMFNESYGLPKYHLSYCQTLQDQQSRNKYHERYVFTHNENGVFNLRLIRGRDNIEDKTAPLDVCKFCLENLAWNNYKIYGGSKTEKESIFKGFNLKDFFIKYPKDILSVLPKHHEKVAPINQYPQNWKQIREKVLRTRGLKCERCNCTSNFSSDFDVHHKNSVQYDVSDSNLIILCVPCHEKEHGHYQGRNTSFG